MYPDEYDPRRSQTPTPKEAPPREQKGAGEKADTIGLPDQGQTATEPKNPLKGLK